MPLQALAFARALAVRIASLGATTVGELPSYITAQVTFGETDGRGALGTSRMSTITVELLAARSRRTVDALPRVSRRMRIRYAAVMLAACHSTPSGAPQPYVETVGSGSGAAVDEITVTVSALRSSEGMVRCSLYDDDAEFPESPKHVVARAVARPTGTNGSCVFRGVTRGRDYAIVVHHDENNDNVFQKSAFGLPEEGYGFSNDAKPRLSAPSFGACKFHYATGELALAITMRY